MTEEFFNQDDELTVRGIFESRNVALWGYFDLTDVSLDEEDYDIETAQFVCQETSWLKNSNGEILVVPRGRYRINKVNPDGTGVAILTLLIEEH